MANFFFLVFLELESTHTDSSETGTTSSWMITDVIPTLMPHAPIAPTSTGPTIAPTTTAQTTDPATSTNYIPTSVFSNTSCKNVDIVHVLDGSGSVGSSGFNVAVNAIADSVDSFIIGTNESRVGVIVYHSNANISLRLEESATLGNEGSKARIKSISFPGGGTRTGTAISLATSHFRSEGLPGNAKVIIVITDGQSGDAVAGPATDATNNGILMYAVGIGPSINNAELNLITNGITNNVLKIAHMSDLAATLKRLDETICAGMSNLQEACVLYSTQGQADSMSFIEITLIAGEATRG